MAHRDLGGVGCSLCSSLCAGVKSCPRCALNCSPSDEAVWRHVQQLEATHGELSGCSFLRLLAIVALELCGSIWQLWCCPTLVTVITITQVAASNTLLRQVAACRTQQLDGAHAVANVCLQVLDAVNDLIEDAKGSRTNSHDLRR